MADPGRPLIPAKDTRTAGGRDVVVTLPPLLEPPPPLPLRMDDLTLWSAAEVTEGTVALLKALRRLDQLLPMEFFDVRRSKCPLGKKTSSSSERGVGISEFDPTSAVTIVCCDSFCTLKVSYGMLSYQTA